MKLSDNQAAVLFALLKNKDNPFVSMRTIKTEAKELMEFMCFDLEVIRFDQDEKLKTKYLGTSE